MTTLAAPELDRPQDSARITPAGLLRRRALQTPGALALLDPPNRRFLNPSAPRRLSYAEADGAADALAAYFAHLGLEAGDRVVMQLPNLIEAPLLLLGAWRAGLTVAAIPMLWCGTEIARVCDMLEPAALVGISRYGEERPAELLRDVAATRLSVRFVLGFGPELPDGVSSLDDAILDGAPAGFVARAGSGPALVTFTARPGVPLVPLFRQEDDILLQGAMAVMALNLGRHDIVLNAYPLTGPVGIAAGLAPWLIGGTALVQHDPFDDRVLVQQILSTGATATALPGTVLDRIVAEGVLGDAQCSLRHVGRVWSAPKLAEAETREGLKDSATFDLYPLGDLASLIVRVGGLHGRGTIPLGPYFLDDGGDVTEFLETALTGGTGSEGHDEGHDIAVRGPVIPLGRANGPVARDANGFVKTGLHGETREGRLAVSRDPELVYHGGFTLAASELDGLYQAFPDFLDAACFVLPDPVVGDRIFAAVVPAPSAAVSLEALHRFLTERNVAPYKFPDKLLVVPEIPRADGAVVREAILRQI